MKEFSADLKHSILKHYKKNVRGHSFADLASLHNVLGGRATVANWYHQWDGTAASLQRKKVSGRPRVLSRAQVNRSVKPRILAANRQHRAVHYPSILSAVRESTQSQVSLRTLQRYGKEELKAKNKHTTKRTSKECQFKQYIIC